MQNGGGCLSSGAHEIRDLLMCNTDHCPFILGRLPTESNETGRDASTDGFEGGLGQDLLGLVDAHDQVPGQENRELVLIPDHTAEVGRANKKQKGARDGLGICLAFGTFHEAFLAKQVSGKEVPQREFARRAGGAGGLELARDLHLPLVHQVDEIAMILGKVDDLPGFILSMVDVTLDPREQVAAHVLEQGMVSKGQRKRRLR